MTYPFPGGDPASLAQCLGKPLLTGQSVSIAPIDRRNRCNVTVAVPLDTVGYRLARSLCPESYVLSSWTLPDVPGA